MSHTDPNVSMGSMMDHSGLQTQHMMPPTTTTGTANFQNMLQSASHPVGLAEIPTANRQKRGRSDTKVKLGGAWPDCLRMIQSLLGHKQASPFLEPVDPIALNIPDYLTVITRPMDLSTIKDKLVHGEYANADEFAEDVRLVWDNCEKYNGPDHTITQWANNLRKIFEKAFGNLKMKEFEALPEGHMANKPKPKKTGFGYPGSKNEISYEEKRQICTIVNSLEITLLPRVVAIIHRYNPNILSTKPENTDELEIPVDSLPIPALREIEDYIREIKSGGSGMY